jgi:hypothetical protein
VGPTDYGYGVGRRGGAVELRECNEGDRRDVKGEKGKGIERWLVAVESCAKWRERAGVVAKGRKKGKKRTRNVPSSPS